MRHIFIQGASAPVKSRASIASGLKETQVVFALITTAEGLPITYKVFPGNTHEVKTLLPLQV